MQLPTRAAGPRGCRRSGSSATAAQRAAGRGAGVAALWKRSAHPRRQTAALAVAEASSTLEFGSNTVQGPRPTQEDRLRVEHGLPGGFTYAAVMDGHGGALSVEWLYDELYASVAAAVDPSFLEDGPEQPPSDALGSGTGGGTPAARQLLKGVRWPAQAGRALSEVFRDADRRLLEFIRGEFGTDAMGLSGSTALVALVHPRKALFASLGDCVAVVCRGGTAVKATQQHRVYGIGPDVLEEVERVKSTGAWVIDGRVCNVLAVSRAFGDSEFKGPGLRALLQEGARKGMWTPEFADTHKFSSDPVIVEPDVTEVVFTPEDEFLLMATDGLWDVMQPQEVVNYARKQFKAGKSAQAVAEAVTGIAVKRYTADNVAAIVVDLRSGDKKSSAGASSGGGGGGLFGGLFGGR
ncbi:hypothetical protein Rsub_02302 [Raphidocelis subcapitata]|uniref:PPM-type phosphatase domain-containing protein n=1 Tax=Raphidocelis subcapitata TaxID=307507 RepID=A0A2V0NPP9_9CHLO|nr:hypothetical protein Rsub_02302 [Raphidocelis subcapitata]|eukprot:GBF89584.1 hypothetical protein Rsub_02302 [Raphidocelis subcapitata]